VGQNEPPGHEHIVGELKILIGNRPQTLPEAIRRIARHRRVDRIALIRQAEQPVLQARDRQPPAEPGTRCQLKRAWNARSPVSTASRPFICQASIALSLSARTAGVRPSATGGIRAQPATSIVAASTAANLIDGRVR
jgi:hypothetical protein